MHPEKAIVAGEAWSFDLEGYASVKECCVVQEPTVFADVTTTWRGRKLPLKRETENSWVNVFWRGQLIDVVSIAWTAACGYNQRYWIIAENRQLAEDFFRAVCEWSTAVRGEILVFADGEWSKNRELYRAIKSATFDKVILQESLKASIQADFAQFFAARDFYERHGIPWKRGVLFIGPPGNGKTQTVKALINQLNQPCLYVKGFQAEHGTEQENIRRVFARARFTMPCLLVMEDLDSMIEQKSISFFLNELDGFETNTGVVVLGTTNHPERLDPAILERPSRFDRKYYFGLPEAVERRAYFVAWNLDLRPELRMSDAAAPELVRQTAGFSFAYLKELVLSAMMQWMTQGGSMSMDAVLLEQINQLRQQMTAAEKSSEQPSREK